MNFKCPCCDYYTLSAPAAHDICSVCFWHDDGEVLNKNHSMGPNHVSLRQARQNFIDFEASEERVLSAVRPPTEEEKNGFDYLLKYEYPSKSHGIVIFYEPGMVVTNKMINDLFGFSMCSAYLEFARRLPSSDGGPDEHEYQTIFRIDHHYENKKNPALFWWVQDKE